VERPVKALLLSNNNGQPVWQLNNEIVTGMQAGPVHFPAATGEPDCPADAGLET
jgi:hypothetical protein